MLVSIIYVNWNCCKDILNSMESVYNECHGFDYEIIVVDNDSEENIDPLRQSNIILIENSKNIGFGGGCNIGAKVAKGDYLVFLNPDTILQGNTIGCLINFLRANPYVGAVGPTVVDRDGNIDFSAGRAFPSIFNEFLEHSTLTFKFPKNSIIGRPYYSTWDHCSTRPVDTLIGACMALPFSVFHEIGGFDENFFLYYEEVDLCHRIWESGYPVYYVHSCKVKHLGKTSTIKYFKTMDAIILQHLKSVYYYFKKHHGNIYAHIWRKMIATIYLLRFLKNRQPEFLEFFKWGIGIV
ncbi:hypothetical protein JCM12298_19160 [Desulfothermus naphthae]